MLEILQNIQIDLASIISTIIKSLQMKIAKVIAGFKSLLEGSDVYEYVFSPTRTYNCKIKMLMKDELENLYPFVTIQSIVNQFSNHMVLPNELLGKRSSEIFTSTSRIYCCKLIDDQSLLKLNQIFNKLLKHRQQNPHSCLIDIYRVFTVESHIDNFRQVDTFIIMPCLRPQFQDLISMFDIKGHVQLRNVALQDFKLFKFGKDQNFVESKQKQLINTLNKKTLEQLADNLNKDATFLSKENIIDYSLLISFRSKDKNNEKNINNCIQLEKGVVMEYFIIDYFQEFNDKKKVENKFKSFFLKDMSSIQPVAYAERFTKFIKKQIGI